MFPGFETPIDLPWTMSFVVRKRQQVDGLRELPKEKRPPDLIVWWGTSEQLESWIDKVFDKKEVEQDVQFSIAQEDIG